MKRKAGVNMAMYFFNPKPKCKYGKLNSYTQKQYHTTKIFPIMSATNVNFFFSSNKHCFDYDKLDRLLRCICEFECFFFCNIIRLFDLQMNQINLNSYSGSANLAQVLLRVFTRAPFKSQKYLTHHGNSMVYDLTFKNMQWYP